VNRKIEPLSVYLGALGMTGMTGWAELNLVDVKAGDVIFISGAAGAVGNVAGQLAKLRRCRVVGSAGSEEKVGFSGKSADLTAPSITKPVRCSNN
jgi:NADPH-dependent curcumin reductase CurA